MYVDDLPVPNGPVPKVIVIEGHETVDDLPAIMEACHGCGAVTYEDAEDMLVLDDDEADRIREQGDSAAEAVPIFWLVWADQPRILRDCTESALRSSLGAATPAS